MHSYSFGNSSLHSISLFSLHLLHSNSLSKHFFQFSINNHLYPSEPPNVRWITFFLFFHRSRARGFCWQLYLAGECFRSGYGLHQIPPPIQFHLFPRFTYLDIIHIKICNAIKNYSHFPENSNLIYQFSVFPRMRNRTEFNKKII